MVEVKRARGISFCLVGRQEMKMISAVAEILTAKCIMGQQSGLIILSAGSSAVAGRANRVECAEANLHGHYFYITYSFLFNTCIHY